VRGKTVLTEIGPVEIGVPRDRDGTFTPQIVRKRQRRLSGGEDMVISLSAKGFGHHHRLSACQRIKQLTDTDSFTEVGWDIAARDPPGFTDRRPYRERMDEAVATTGEREAALFGDATIDTRPVVIVAMDFGFMGGSMSTAVGEVVTRAAERRTTPEPR